MPNSILIIDDNAEFTSTLHIQLESEGFRVASALNPVTGWKEMERFQPDIILLDWELAEMNGLDLLKLIKADPAHRRRYVIMVTGYTGTKNIVEGLDAGADDYIEKKFNNDELLARIRSGLRIRALEERISEETRRSTTLEMALSFADKIGNPIAAARIYQQLVMRQTDITDIDEVRNSIKTIGELLDEAIDLINKFHSLTQDRSTPVLDDNMIVEQKLDIPDVKKQDDAP
jgi:phosphoserine phosphatase RsbU/P